MMLVPDFETKLLIDLRPALLAYPVELAKLDAVIRKRAEMVRLGLMRCPTWFQEELNALDSRLRAWWDSEKERWVIDRLQDGGIAEQLERSARADGDQGRAVAIRKSAEALLDRGPYYLTVVQFAPTPERQLDRTLIAMLRSFDMQRSESPSAYQAEKTERAEKTQYENDRAGTAKVAAAVDGLSAKQIRDFIAVEEAIQSGETITAHGPDARLLERAAKATPRAKRRSENPAAALNPGMDPRIYKRRRKDNI